MLSVTLNAAGIVPSANNRLTAQRYGTHLQPEGIDQIMLHERLNQICA